MDTTKFHPEATVPAESFAERVEPSFAASPESQLAAIESIVLGLLVRGSLSEYDKSTIDELFPAENRPFIIKETECLYPEQLEPEQLSLWIIVYQDHLATGDLKNQYPQLISELEQGWTELVSASHRTKKAFKSSSTSLLVNRSSGRIIAAGHRSCNTREMLDRELVGREFGLVHRFLQEPGDLRNLQIDNFTAHQVPLSLVRLSTAEFNSSIEKDEIDADKSRASTVPLHKVVDEPLEINIHVNRFNALLENNFQSALPQGALNWLESAISQIIEYSGRRPDANRFNTGSNSYKACLRLMMQSVLMSHRVTVGQSADTSMLVFCDNQQRLNVRFVTPVETEQYLHDCRDEWWELARELCERIGFTAELPVFQTNSFISNFFLSI